MVFPGGVADRADDFDLWHRSSDKGQKFEDSIRKERSMRITAIRETFEESGIPFLTNAPKLYEDKAEVLRWRELVHNDAHRFRNMCDQFGCSPDLDALRPWAHWITPPQEPKRYDTMFYVARADSSMLSEAEHDKTETVSSQWLSPDEALDSFERGSIWLAPPTWFLLREMAQFHNIDELFSQDMHRDLSPVLPDIVVENATRQQIRQRFGDSVASALPSNLEQQHHQHQLVMICMPGDKNNTARPDSHRFNRIVMAQPHRYVHLECAFSQVEASKL